MSLVYYLMIFCYGTIVLTTLPAFLRLVSSQSRIFDGVKACCALLAASITNNLFVRGEDGWALPPDFSKAIGSSLTVLCFVMLVIVVWRTEKALRGGGES
jgi:hypothetical protein